LLGEGLRGRQQKSGNRRDYGESSGSSSKAGKARAGAVGKRTNQAVSPSF